MKDTGKLMSMLAFIVLIITAVIWAVLFVIAVLANMNVIDGASVNLGWLRLISDILVVAVVVFYAWEYVKDKSMVWKIFFIIGAVIAVLGVFGVNLIPPVK